MFQYSTIGAQPASPYYAPSPASMGFVPPSAHVGAMVPHRYYDIVGAEPEGTWDKIKKWGDERTWGIQNKWLVGAAVVGGVAWYGYYAGWFGR